MLLGVAASLMLILTTAEARSLSSFASAVEGGPCTCVRSSPPYQLIRGDDAPAICRDGYYCDCAKNNVTRCKSSIEQFSEDMQECGLGGYDYCESAFEDGSTPATPAEVTTPQPTEATAAGTTATDEPSTPCTCASSTPPLQLIRGEGQVESCRAGFYCDCAAKAVSSCGSFYLFIEEIQQCFVPENADYCETAVEDVSSPATAPEDTTPQSSPATSASDSHTSETEAPVTEPPSAPCACASSTPPLQLIRGEGQVERCHDGDYCDCAKKVVTKCDMLHQFVEEEQRCTVLDFEYCVNFFAPHSSPADTTTGLTTPGNRGQTTPGNRGSTTPGNRGSTTPGNRGSTTPGGSAAPSGGASYASSVPIVSISLSIMCGIVSVGAIYTIRYCVMISRHPRVSRAERVGGTCGGPADPPPAERRQPAAADSESFA